MGECGYGVLGPGGGGTREQVAELDDAHFFSTGVFCTEGTFVSSHSCLRVSFPDGDGTTDAPFHSATIAMDLGGGGMGQM